MFINVITGACLLGGCSRKQAVITPPVVEEKKEDPADRQAAAEKIAGYAHPEALISVYELNQKIYDTSIFTLDTRGRSYEVFLKSYRYGHIPGAVPILHESYTHPKYTDRIATPPQLQDVLGGLGADNESTVVLYGNDGLQARLFWAMRMYGYDNVKILDGGLDKWKEAGYDITSANSVRPPDTFEFDLARSKMELLATLNEVEAAIGNPNNVIVDTRSRDEYLYKHIPGSINFFYAELLNKDLTFKSASDLKALAENKKITPDKKIIVYCDSGVDSSLVWFAFSQLLGYPNVKNYDGSLNEWLKMDRKTQSGE
ncbi:sulfurtransferase [Pelotomaculum isophthalicicum JI]|uniref:thiosulfate sulfurtransferase n=1 Tax=Pelotomaculum isophthalicicum JI TaxID=947010 RepID=A0A9X4H177_9FIRM|nr:sulfurtransferase [Pelotomaculum isophthalicicum]MDF9407845.1 sulfurtransferase [Pelotomaculum isophthalicicum JI]